ncbi:hypothetical protein Tco_1180162 [Tanacetum coccineum]
MLDPSINLRENHLDPSINLRKTHQSSGPQLDDEDLELLDQDNLEEMDIKWQVAMLSMRVKIFIRTLEEIHFARECKAPRNQWNMNGDAGYRSRDNTRRTVPVETFDALVVQDNALIEQDGLGYDWNLESVEAQLVVHQKNEVVYEENIAVLEFEVKDKNKTGLGYGDQVNENSSDNGLLNSVFDSRSSDGDDNQTNDRPTTNKTSASVSQVETSNTLPSSTSVEISRVEYIRPSGVIIEDWVSDDKEDIFQSEDSQTTVKPSFKKIEFTKARNEIDKIDKQVVKPRMVTQSPKVDRKDWNGIMTQKLVLFVEVTII